MFVAMCAMMGSQRFPERHSSHERYNPPTKTSSRPATE